MSFQLLFKFPNFFIVSLVTNKKNKERANVNF